MRGAYLPIRCRQTKIACFVFLSFAGLVVLAKSLNPIPSRTRPLNSSAPMVLWLKPWESRSLPGLPRTRNSPLSMFEIQNAASGNRGGVFVCPRECRVACIFSSSLAFSIRPAPATRPAALASCSRAMSRSSHSVERSQAASSWAIHVKAPNSVPPLKPRKQKI